MTSLSDFFRGYPYQTAYKNANYTAVSGDYILVGSDTGAITITLPPTPSLNDFVFVSDADDNAGTNNITIARNGQTIDGNAADFIINVNGGRVDLVYDGTTWKVGYTTPGASIPAEAWNKTITGTTYTILSTDKGFNLIFTNAAAIAITLPDGLDVDFQCSVIQANTGVPTVTPATDTINGAGTGVAPDAQWKGMYLTKYTGTGWLALY